MFRFAVRAPRSIDSNEYRRYYTLGHRRQPQRTYYIFSIKMRAPTDPSIGSLDAADAGGDGWWWAPFIVRSLRRLL